MIGVPAGSMQMFEYAPTLFVVTAADDVHVPATEREA